MSLYRESYESHLIWRHRMGQAFEWLCRLATLGALAILIVLLGSVFLTALSPGRGKGTAPVSLASSAERGDAAEKFRVTNIYGGQFEVKNRPGKRVAEFTASEVRDGQIVFQHNGRRDVPAFD